jgi:ABC-2 type transport system ATP-binding protein
MIEFKDVSKSYAKQMGEKKAFQALSNISFALKKGSALGLIGANGAGKSTSIRLLMDFIRPDSGSIRLFGKTPKEASVRKYVGYLPEMTSFPKNLTCMEMLTFTGKVCGMQKQDIEVQAKRWLGRLGLWEHRNRLLRGYSKGMQQRASFAMALVHDPEVLILDEPMSGLDPLGRADIVSLIEELKLEGKTILFCSHLLDDVERLTDEVLILHKGEVKYYGALDDVRHDKHGWHIKLEGGEEVFAESREALNAVLAEEAKNIVDVQAERESFEQAFLRLVQGGEA